MMTGASSKRLKNISLYRPFIYGNVATPLTDKQRTPTTPVDHTHSWTIFVRGPQGEDLSYFIKKVVFKLHDTYANSTRTVDAPPYEVTETGWGEFEITIKIYFHSDANEKNVTLYHHLKLHPYGYAADQVPTSNEVKSIIYDEIVFNEPTEIMFEILTRRPLLPQQHGGFSQERENEEMERYEYATQLVLDKTRKTRDLLQRMEKEKATLTKQ